VVLLPAVALPVLLVVIRGVVRFWSVSTRHVVNSEGQGECQALSLMATPTAQCQCLHDHPCMLIHSLTL
jgi:hypothetical protein